MQLWNENDKLHDRALRIVSQATGVSRKEAGQVLADSGDQAKAATVMILLSVDAPSERGPLRASSEANSRESNFLLGISSQKP